MEKYQKLSERFKNKKGRAEDIVQHSKINHCEQKISQLQKKVMKGNEVVTEDIRHIEDVYNSSVAVIHEIEKSNVELTKTIKNLENFGTKHVSIREALKGAKEILKHVETTSKSFTKQKDNEIYGFCSNVSQKVIDMYKPPPSIPKLMLQDLKDKIDDIVNTTTSVGDTCDMAEEMNLSNARKAVKIKEKIEKLKNSNQVHVANVEETMIKINATNELLPALVAVFGNLKNIFNFTEHPQLESIVRQQMKENPQIEELSVRAMDHVQELEYQIESYKR